MDDDMAYSYNDFGGTKDYSKPYDKVHMIKFKGFFEKYEKLGTELIPNQNFKGCIGYYPKRQE